MSFVSCARPAPCARGLRSAATRACRWPIVVGLLLALVAHEGRSLPSDGSTLAGDRGAVRAATLDGAVEPDLASGAATWSLPIEVPAGAGGLTPELALRYSSTSRRESWVGTGWALGLSSITRSVRRGVPTGDDARDRFELDGEELVRDPAIPSRYHTRHERFLRIERESDGSWTVRRTSGIALRFGTRPDARIDDAGGNTFEWLTTELEDPLGNAITAHYDRRDEGIAYLAEVRWTLRRDAIGTLRSLGDDPARDRVLRFVLEPRPDLATSHAAGFPRRLAHRLARIDVLAAGALLRRYAFEFAESAESGQSLLASVAQHGSDADALQPTPPRVTRFAWTGSRSSGGASFARDTARETSWPASFSFVDADRSDGGVRLADLDGDGRPDLVKAFAVHPATGGDPTSTPDSGVHLATSTGFEATASTRWPLPVFDGVTGNRIPLAFAFSFADGTRWGSGSTLIDLTGDGRADVFGAIGFAAGSAPASAGPLAQSVQSEWCINTGAGFACRRPAPEELDGVSVTGKQGATFDFGQFGYAFTLLAGNVQFADVDGDGLPDLVVRSRDRFLALDGSCQHESITSFVSHNEGALGFVPLALEPIAPPIGACRASSQTIGRAHQPCPPRDLFCGSRLFHNETQLYADGFGSGLWLFAGQQELGRLELDIDADGLSDVVGAGQGPSGITPFAALGDGAGGYLDSTAFAPPEALVERTPPAILDPFSDGHARDLGLRFADLNGDGRLDLVRAREGDPAGPALWWNRGERSDGTSAFARDDVAAAALPAGLAFVDAAGRDLGWRTIDLDGDGLPDFVHSAGGVIEIWRQSGELPDLLREITLPAGGRIRLDYTPASRFDHRDAGGLSWLASTSPLLTSIELDDASGNPPSRTVLEYAGGVFDSVRRELRGFARVTVTDPLGQPGVSTFHVDEARAGLPESVLRLDTNGRALAEWQFEYTNDEDGLPPFVALLAATTRLEWDGAATARRSRIERIYDEGGPITLGNLTEEIELGEVDDAGRDLDPEDTRTREWRYAPEHPALHLADRVRTERVWRGRAGIGVLARESQLFYDGDGTGLAVPTRGLVTRRVERLDEPGSPDPTVRFEHDAAGNVIAIHDPRSEAGEGGGTTRFEIDPLFATFRVATTNPLGQRSEVSLEADPSCPLALPAGFGLPQVERGPNERLAGTARVRCFDAFGRQVLDRSPGGHAHERTIHDDTPGAVSIQRMLRASEEGGERGETITFDGFGRERTRRASAAGGRISISERGYDANGRIAFETAPHDPAEPARVTTHRHDALGRRIETHLPGSGRVWRRSTVHGVLTETDPEGHVTQRTFDTLGRLRRVGEHEAGAVHETTYDWSALDLLERITDAEGHVTSLVYDRLGRRRLLIDPAIGAEAAAFDAAGNVIERWSGAGIARWRYDALDRPLEQRVGAEVDARFRWDSAPGGIGRLASRFDAAGSLRIEAYDEAGRATRETHLRAGHALVFETDFDPLGQPRERRFPDGSRLVWAHDGAGFLREIWLDDHRIASEIDWDAAGRLARWQAGNGVDWQARVDATNGRLDSIRVEDAASNALADLRWRFDAADRVLGIDDALDVARGREFVHDDLGRLVQARGPFGANGSPLTLHYAYDAPGNLLCLDGLDPVHCTGGRRFEIDPSNGRRLLRVDAMDVTNGASGRIESIGNRRYAYDGLDHLLSVSEGGRTRSRIVVDASGRVARRVDSVGGRDQTREQIGSDFSWNRSRDLATLEIGLGGSAIASVVVPFDADTAAAAASQRRSRMRLAGEERFGIGPTRLTAIGVSSLVGLLAAMACAGASRLSPARRRSGLRALVGASTTVAFVAATSAHPAPDGDLDGNGAFDAADLLRAFQIAREERIANADELARGDVAPIGGGARTASIDDGDVAVLLRGLRGEDVDGDGLRGDEESALGSNPFLADSDADGLSDGEERTRGLDPLAPDTDEDGFADGLDAAPRSGTHWIHPDALGSPMLRTRADGVVFDRPLFRPFGARVDDASNSSAPGFAALRFEAASSLYEAGARHYDPALGRFLQADELSPDPSDPQLLGRQIWGRNDPLRRIDPDGRFPRLGMLLGAAVGAFVLGSSDTRRDRHEEDLFTASLGMALGQSRIGFSLDDGGDLKASLGLLAGIPLLESAQQTSAVLRNALRGVAFASLRFGDVLITRDGGSAQAIALIPGMGEYGHAAFVIDPAPQFGVASSDNRGRYYASNDDASVGGRSFDVFRTGEALDPTLVRAHLDDLQRSNGFGGGLRQYLGNGGDNICSEFVATLYREAGGHRLDGIEDRFVTPGDLAARLGPPIGEVFIPRAARAPGGGGR